MVHCRSQGFDRVKLGPAWYRVSENMNSYLFCLRMCIKMKKKKKRERGKWDSSSSPIIPGPAHFAEAIIRSSAIHSFAWVLPTVDLDPTAGMEGSFPPHPIVHCLFYGKTTRIKQVGSWVGVLEIGGWVHYHLPSLSPLYHHHFEFEVTLILPILSCPTSTPNQKIIKTKLPSFFFFFLFF